MLTPEDFESPYRGWDAHHFITGRALAFLIQGRRCWRQDCISNQCAHHSPYIIWSPAAISDGTIKARMDLYYHELDKSVLVLSADGGLNADTAQAFVDQLTLLVDQGLTKIIVDCSQLDYIKSEQR